MKVDESTSPPTIRTERLVLRPMRLSDAEDIFAYASDEEVTRHMTWPTHRTIEETQGYLEFTKASYQRGNHYDYAIELAESGCVIGAGGAFRGVEEYGKSAEGGKFAEIGYVLNRAYWGRGYMPEAMGAFVRFLFENRDVHRIEAFHLIENKKSGRVMQKIGMAYEGTMQDKYFIKGAYRTIQVYAILNPAHERALP